MRIDEILTDSLEKNIKYPLRMNYNIFWKIIPYFNYNGNNQRNSKQENINENAKLKIN